MRTYQQHRIWFYFTQFFEALLTLYALGLESRDLDMVLKARKLDSILIPKVESANDIKYVCRRLDQETPQNLFVVFAKL